MNDNAKPPVAGAIAPPAATLSELRAQLQDARIKVDRFQAFNLRLSNATASLDRAERALASFRTAEAEALAQWAEAGDGPPPRADDAAYAQLKIAREAAVRDRDDAESAARAVAPANLKAILAANEIQERIEARLAQAVADEFARLAATLDADLESLQTRLATVLGAQKALADRAATIDRTRRPALAAAIGRMAHNLDFPSALSISATQAEVFRSASEWNAKLQPPEPA